MYYSGYQNQIPITDDYGNKTGEYEPVYSKPTEFYAYVSPAKGEAEIRRFGETLSYDKVIVTDKESPYIDELTYLWVDTMPELDNQGELATNASGQIITPHDYIVKKVAKGLNSIVIAIRKVKVSD